MKILYNINFIEISDKNIYHMNDIIDKEFDSNLFRKYESLYQEFYFHIIIYKIYI